MPTNDKVGFRDIKDQILARIRDRIWAPGSIMPGEIELAQEFGCARATVNRAMRELAEEGFLDRKRKTGTRVNANPVRQAKFEIPLVRIEIEASGAAYRYALVNCESPPTPDWLRARLGLAPTDEVLHLQCMHYADNAPFQFEDRWINKSTVQDIDCTDFETLSPNEWLVNKVPFTEAEISFSATAANESNADLLALPIGEPVFTAERITWLQTRPITFARMFFGRGYRMTTRF